MSGLKQAPLEPPPSYEDSRPQSVLSEKRPPGTRSPLPRPPFPLELPALISLRGKRVVLASASPRRKQLLGQIGLTNLDIVPSTAPEDLSKSLTPYEYVLQTATQKALNVYTATIDDAARGEPALLIAADTVVVAPTGAILEKPRSEAQHLAVLKDLRDAGRHSVVTAVAVMAPLANPRDPGYALETAVEETAVTFDRELTDDMLLAYVRTREGADKAGGYGIQGMGALLVEKIDGNFENVVGLPLRVTLRLIEKVLQEAQEEGSDDE